MKTEETEKTLGLGLCFRCEHRAVFLETGYHPRFECGMEKMASSGCYMFMPCKPVAVTPNPGEKRPMFGPWMIAGRLHALGLVDAERIRLRLIDVGGPVFAAVWTIKPNKKIKKANMGAEVQRERRPTPEISGIEDVEPVPAPSPFDPALIRGLNNGAAALRRTRVQAKKMGISIG